MAKRGIFYLIFVTIVCLLYSHNVFALTDLTDNEISAINVLNGKLVCSLNDGYQERYFKANIIKNLNRDVEVISVGSSHFMTLSNEAISGDYINLSIGGANLQDKLNILGLLDLYGVNYKKIVFEIDITTFTENSRNSENYGENFKTYGDYFCNKILFENGGIIPQMDFNSHYVNQYADNKLWDLFATYDYTTLPRFMVYYKPDASQGYPKEIYELEGTNREEQSVVLANFDKSLIDKTILDEPKIIMDALMKFFYNKGVEVVLAVVPRSPKVFDTSLDESSKFISSIYQLLDYYHTNYGVHVCGSFNPHILGVHDDDFYDAMHLKPEVINRLYLIR